MSLSAIEFAEYAPDVVLAEGLTTLRQIEDRIAADGDGLAGEIANWLALTRESGSPTSVAPTSQAKDSDLPAGLALSPGGVHLSARQAVLAALQDELTTRAMADGDTLDSWGGLLTQSDPNLRPVYEMSSVRFTGARVLSRNDVFLDIETGGGMTAVVRVKVNSLPNQGRIFAFSNADVNARIILKRGGDDLVLRFGTVEMTVAPLVVGEWVTLAMSYDATTRATTVYKDGVEQAKATLGDLRDLNFEYFALGGSANSAGTDISISGAAFYTRKLPDIDAYPATRETWTLRQIDEDAAAVSAILDLYAPDEPSRLALRPPIEAAVSAAGDRLTFVVVEGGRDLFASQTLWITDGEREVVADVLDVDPSASELTLEGGVLLGDVNAFINAASFRDPDRVARIAAFRRRASTPLPGPVDEAAEGFNSDLYLLLYGPVEPELKTMTERELEEHYVSNPGRVGSVLDIQRATDLSGIRVARIDELLTLPLGAALRLAGRELTGVGTRNDVLAGTAIVDDETVATTGQVSETVAVAVRGIETYAHLTDARVTGTLTVEGRAIAGEGEFGTLGARVANLDNVVARDGLDARRLTAQSAHVTGDLVAEKARLVKAEATDLRVTGAVTADGTVDAQTVTARAGIFDTARAGTLRVDDDAIVEGRVRAAVVSADLLAGEDVATRGLAVSEDASVAGTVRARIGEFNLMNAVQANLDSASIDALSADSLAVGRGVAAASGAFQNVATEALSVSGAADLTELDAQSLRADRLQARKVTADSATLVQARAGRIDAGTLFVADRISPATEGGVVKVAGSLHAADSAVSGTASAGLVVGDRIQTQGRLDAGSVLAESVATERIRAGSAVANDVQAERVLASSLVAAPSVQAARVNAGEVDADRANLRTANVAGALTADDVTAGSLTSAGSATVAELDVRDNARIQRGEVAQLSAGSVTVTGDVDAKAGSFGTLRSGDASCEIFTADEIDARVLVRARRARIEALRANKVYTCTVSAGDVDVERKATVADLVARYAQLDSMNTNNMRAGKVSADDVDADRGVVRRLTVTDAARVRSLHGETVRALKTDTDQLQVSGEARIARASVEGTLDATRVSVAGDVAVAGDLGAMGDVSAAGDVRAGGTVAASAVDVSTVVAGGGAARMDAGGVVVEAGTLVSRVPIVASEVRAGTLTATDARASRLSAKEAATDRLIAGRAHVEDELHARSATIGDARVTGLLDAAGGVTTPRLDVAHGARMTGVVDLAGTSGLVMPSLVRVDGVVSADTVIAADVTATSTVRAPAAIVRRILLCRN
jgi:hypothetical protein